MNIGITAHKQIYHVHAIERIDLFVCGEQPHTGKIDRHNRMCPTREAEKVFSIVLEYLYKYEYCKINTHGKHF